MRPYPFQICRRLTRTASSPGITRRLTKDSPPSRAKSTAAAAMSIEIGEIDPNTAVITPLVEVIDGWFSTHNGVVDVADP